MYAVAPTRTIVYCRVSLDKQAEKGVSLAAQQAKAKALLVVKLDRLTRSVADLGRLVERYFAPGKAALLSVGEQIDTRSAAGRLVLNVLASVSQWEREAIGERTATAMQHKAKQGEYTGGWAPYGRRVAADGSQLEAQPDEEAARAVARQLRAQGLSLRAVAAELERRGVRSRTGRGFAPVQVKRMVAQRPGSAPPRQVPRSRWARTTFVRIDWAQNGR